MTVIYRNNNNELEIMNTLTEKDNILKKKNPHEMQ